MNEQLQEFDASTIQRAKRFEEVCDEFESQCSAGNRPSIESFLLRVDGPEKQPLLLELIAIEMHYRRQNGESIAFLEYQTRFPDLAHSWFVATIQKVGDQPMNEPIKTDAPNAESGFEKLRKHLQPSSRLGWLGRLTHYEVEQILGQGAFGIVAKAFDERLHRVVAIKFMNPDLAATSPPRKRFIREARTAAAIRHENIVGIYAIEEEPLPYIVMEYIPGVTLQQWLDQNGPLELSEFLRIAQQLAAGLAAAHAANLIHRDIKPSNILLESGIDKHAKISDFGLARAVDDASLTSSGLIAGTPMYMAPEQARGEVLDHRADLFSLGSVLYQMASGRPPFRAANTVAMLKRVCEDTPRPIQDVIPETPDWLCKIIVRLLEKRPADRYQTAKEVADLLAHFQSELKLNGKVASIGKRERNRNLETQSIRRGALESNASIANLSEVGVRISRLSALAQRRRTWLLGGALSAIVASVSVATFRYRESGLADPGISKQEASISSGPNQESKNSISTVASHVWPADAPPPAIAPFDAEQARQHQEAWAKYLNVPVEFTNSIGITFRLIPPGDFSMGMTVEEAEALAAVAQNDTVHQQMFLSSVPKHRVILQRSFYLSIHEVTQAQFKTIMGTTPSFFSSHGRGAEMVNGESTDAFPVEDITSGDAEDFCNKLSLRDMRTPVYSATSNEIKRSADGYRLPTEAEWEWACRAGTTTTWSYGDRVNALPTYAWFGSSASASGRTHQVGQLASNPFGLFDMHGNVLEWCQDWHGQNYYGLRLHDATVDPIGPETGIARVIRGGNWATYAILQASACRRHFDPNLKVNGIGFRVALSIAETGGVETRTRELSKEAVKSTEVDETSQVLRVVEVTPATPSSQAEETEASNPGSGWHGWGDDAPAPAIAPFDAEQARQNQEAWAKYLKVPVELTNSIGMKLRLIPPGEFMMGSTPEEVEEALKWFVGDKRWHEPIRSEAPQHKVILTKPMYLGVTEVTQAEYLKVMGSNPSYFAPNGLGKEEVAGIDTSLHPVEVVTWNDAAEFCTKLSKKEKRKPFYNRSGDKITELNGTGYRLPTEAEWEFACRGGTATKFWTGDEDDGLMNAEWFRENSEMHSQAVSNGLANPFGLFDMHGNVAEWTQDRWQSTYYGKFRTAPAINPTGPASPDTMRMTRGGCFPYNSSALRTAARFPFNPGNFMSGCGFRVALVVERP